MKKSKTRIKQTKQRGQEYATNRKQNKPNIETERIKQTPNKEKNKHRNRRTR